MFPLKVLPASSRQNNLHIFSSDGFCRQDVGSTLSRTQL